VNDPNDNIPLQAILSSPYDAVCILDADGRFEYINPTFLALCGRKREELIGKGLMKIIPPDQHRVMLERWNAAAHGADAQYEADILAGGGERRILLISQWCLSVGDTFKCVLTAKDVTAEHLVEAERELQRRRLEDKVQQRTAALVGINARLSRSEAALARAQTTARIGSWEWDMISERPEWSDEMFRLHGLTPGPLAPSIAVGFAAVHPSDRDYVRRILETAIQAKAGLRAEYRIVRPDGQVVEVLALADAIIGSGGNVLAIAGTLQDITERRRLEREIVDVSRQEQQRIGRDIHDSLGQELTGLALMAKALENRVKKTAPKLAARAADVSGLAGVAAARARDLSHGLSPVDIVAEGLSMEMRRMSERVRSLYGVKCHFTVTGDDRVHDNAVATHLYYIVQEAVTNAVKHASPSSITVEMESGNEGRLEISDDGKGIRLPLDETNSGIGLRIMRHRAEIIGARLSIEPLPGRGTRVSCVFPNLAPVPAGGKGG